MNPAPTPPRAPGERALWCFSTSHVGAAGEIVPTAEEVEVLENLPGGRARVRTRTGARVLTWYEDLFPDAETFPNDVQLILPEDGIAGASALAAAAVEGAVTLREALEGVGPEEILELHRRCPTCSLLGPEEVQALEGAVSP